MSADFEFMLTLDKPRLFRVNAASRRSFHALTDLKFPDFVETFASRSTEEKVGIFAFWLYATGFETDPSLTFGQVASNITRDLIFDRLPKVFKNARENRQWIGRN